MSTDRRLQLSLGSLGVILVGGTVGYQLIEHWDLLDALYMTLITVTTVGFSETHPLTTTGKAFTALLVVMGVGATFYSLGLLFQVLIEGRIREVLGRRKMERRVRDMKDHYVVCGYGRVGVHVTDEFNKRGKSVVVIESRDARIEELAQNKIPFVPGNAAEDEALVAAGVKNASGLVIAIPSAAENVFIALSARRLNPDLTIIARADDPETQNKIVMAGADRVVCPYELGGLRMSSMALSPNVVEFINVAASGCGDGGLSIEEITVEEGSELVDMTLRDAPIRSRYDLSVVGLKKQDGSMRINPPPDTVIAAEDILIIIGEKAKLDEFQKMTVGPVRA